MKPTRFLGTNLGLISLIANRCGDGPFPDLSRTLVTRYIHICIRSLFRLQWFAKLTSLFLCGPGACQKWRGIELARSTQRFSMTTTTINLKLDLISNYNLFPRAPRTNLHRNLFAKDCTQFRFVRSINFNAVFIVKALRVIRENFQVGRIRVLNNWELSHLKRLAWCSNCL